MWDCYFSMLYLQCNSLIEENVIGSKRILLQETIKLCKDEKRLRYDTLWNISCYRCRVKFQKATLIELIFSRYVLRVACCL